MKRSSWLVVPALPMAVACHGQAPPQPPKPMEVKSDFDPATDWQRSKPNATVWPFGDEVAKNLEPILTKLTTNQSLKVSR
ncbi:MAG: hypothetical protein WC740_02680 [Verrucomicrobiia bacterium]